MIVYYIVGKDAKKQTVELAKFFERGHAEDHKAKLTRPSWPQTPWTDLTIEEREESLDDQHHAHGGKVGK